MLSAGLKKTPGSHPRSVKLDSTVGEAQHFCSESSLMVPINSQVENKQVSSPALRLSPQQTRDSGWLPFVFNAQEEKQKKHAGKLMPFADILKANKWNNRTGMEGATESNDQSKGRLLSWEGLFLEWRFNDCQSAQLPRLFYFDCFYSYIICFVCWRAAFKTFNKWLLFPVLQYANQKSS